MAGEAEAAEQNGLLEIFLYAFTRELGVAKVRVSKSVNIVPSLSAIDASEPPCDSEQVLQVSSFELHAYSV